jgi:radical SAM superfamily enzyme YgiQ (UPF0313 family)
MVNASFVFGMDDDDDSVFARTVEWAVRQGVETATFHILTPYPGTALYSRMIKEGRIHTFNWDLYDTRHTVFSPKRLTPEALEKGYWQAYRDFYTWKNIFRSANAHGPLIDRVRHAAYAGGWKKFEPAWGWIIRAQRVTNMRPALEGILGAAGLRASVSSAKTGEEESPAIQETTSVGPM